MNWPFETNSPLFTPQSAVVMRILFNGEPRELVDGATVADLVRQAVPNARYVAVERNGEVVPRDRHASTRLHEGDQIEVVTLVGGG
ncbi:MAG: Sulfur carrier protein ThiS [Planctomycetota bacterium]